MHPLCFAFVKYCYKFSFSQISVLQEFKGYVFKIMGGCDKQGFPMKQGVLTPGRVRLLLHRGWPNFLLLVHATIYQNPLKHLGSL